jgi:hypothetical protein
MSVPPPLSQRGTLSGTNQKQRTRSNKLATLLNVQVAMLYGLLYRMDHAVGVKVGIS